MKIRHLVNIKLKLLYYLCLRKTKFVVIGVKNLIAPVATNQIYFNPSLSAELLDLDVKEFFKDAKNNLKNLYLLVTLFRLLLQIEFICNAHFR